MNHTQTLASIATQFAITGPIGVIEPLGKGLINDTFRVRANGACYVLQRINARVFPNPERIMGNLQTLCAHAGKAAHCAIALPALIHTRDGSPFLRGDDAEIWRLMEFIAHGVTLGHLDGPRQAREVGLALGRFHCLTQDLAPGSLTMTLPDFHRTPLYLARHLEVRDQVMGAASTQALEDLEAIQSCFDFIDARRELTQVLERALVSGVTQERIIHGDPKLDNMLFHAHDGHALALIDLDTVQPGLIQHDLGDCLRSCCNRQGESPANGVTAVFDLDLCKSILESYGSQTRAFLGTEEIDTLYDGLRIMPFELGLRFLTDHLEGDPYFRVTHRGQNLYKAQVQFALLADIESKEETIREIIRHAFRLS